MSDLSYWEKVHQEKYSQADWITKPTIFATEVIKYFPQSGRILELGAGQGQDSSYFAQHGYHVLATDFSLFAMDQAKKRLSADLSGLVDFQTVDLHNLLPFSPASFDVVYSHLALHYFTAERTQNLFNEIYTVLKPGGIFATLTNAVSDPEITGLQPIETGLYQIGDIQKRFFSTDTLLPFVKNFRIILLDNQGTTHKDKIKTLIRFVGKKP